LGVEVRDRHEFRDNGLFSYIFEAEEVEGSEVFSYMFEAEEIEGSEESSSSCALPAPLSQSDKLLTVLKNNYIPFEMLC